MRRVQLTKILFLTLFWALAAIFIVAYDTAVESAAVGGPRPDQSLWRDLAVAIMITIGAGLPMATFEVLFLSRRLRRRPYGVALMTSTLFYLACMVLFISLAILVILALERDLPVYHASVLSAFAGFVASPRFLMTMLYWGLVVLLGLFVLLVSEKFGHRIFIDLLTGRYHQPKQEHRIFMFLDLRSSTAIAEQLGHVRYSELIQDCFFDLTDVAVRGRAQIYQYVGDEVILSWVAETGARGSGCIRLFYDYDDVLRSRSEYYQNKYGLTPTFKAGINAGLVTVAEVGEIKKELAYHGDVLNVAARIQSKCNEVGQRLLVSQALRDLVQGGDEFVFRQIGELELRGKSERVEVYAVDHDRATAGATGNLTPASRSRL
jgi:adenylate cyclase